MRLVTLCGMALTVATPAAAANELKTAAAVIAADNAWLDAEVRGDADYLDTLLLPGYRSVGTQGKVTGKTQLVESARKRGPSPDKAAQVAKWKTEHPTRPDVTIVGDTAILTWISAKPGNGEPVSSCDIFVYDHGRWRALYSQHSMAAT